MQRRKPLPPPDARLSLPVVVQVGTHALSIVLAPGGRWTVSVDGVPTEGSFQTQVEAWEAGVRAADERERQSYP
jgi:hypothetical protein